MTSADWQTIGVIFAIFTGLIGVFYLARASARESTRVTQEARQQYADAAVKPVQALLDTANAIIARRDRTIELRDERINQLEDESRRGRGRDRNGQD